MIHHQKKKKIYLEIARPISDLSYNHNHTHTHTLQAPCNSVHGSHWKSHLKPIGESSHPSLSPQDSTEVTPTILLPKRLAVKDGLRSQVKNKNPVKSNRKKNATKPRNPIWKKRKRKRKKKKKEPKPRTSPLCSPVWAVAAVGWTRWGLGQRGWVKGMKCEEVCLDLGMKESFCGLGFWCEGKSCWWGLWKGESDLTKQWQ